MSPESFQRYLEDQRKRGAFDSSGTFSIDWSKAQLKLGRFQLGHPAGYLLKLVQAGVALRAGQIKVVLDRLGVKLMFYGIELDCASVVELFSKPLAADTQEPLGLLGVGLNAAPATTIEVYDHQRGEGVRLGPEPQTLTTWKGEALVRIFITRAATAAQRAIEHDSLCDRVTFCPIPVWLDGRRLNERAHSAFYQAFPLDPWLGNGLLGEALGPGRGLGIATGRAAIRYEGDLRRPTQTQHPDTLIHLGEPGQLRADSTVIIPLAVRGPNQVHLVQCGVTIAIKNWPLCCPGARAALCLDGWATDLSGFAVRDTDRLERELVKLNPLCLRLAELVDHELNCLELVLPPRVSPLEKCMVGAVLGLGMGVCLGPPGLFLGAVATGAAAGLAAGVWGKLTGGRKSWVDQCRQTLRQRLPGGSSGQS